MTTLRRSAGFRVARMVIKTSLEAETHEPTTLHLLDGMSLDELDAYLTRVLAPLEEVQERAMEKPCDTA